MHITREYRIVRLVLFLILMIAGSFVFAGQAFAATYYLDTTGGVDANDGLTAETAWQTTGKLNAANLEPGDIVLLKKGETFGKLTLVTADSGAEGNPVTFSTYGEGENPIIDATGQTYGLDIQAVSYVRFEDFTIQGATTGQVLLLGPHSGLEFDNITTSGGAYGYYILSGLQTEITITNNTITNFSTAGINAGSWLTDFTVTGTTFSTGPTGIAFDAVNVTNVVIASTTINSLTSSGITAVSGSTITTMSMDSVTANGNGANGIFLQGTISDLTIEDSTFSSNTGSGVAIQPGSGKTVAGLTITNVTTSSNGSIGMNLGGTGSGSAITMTELTASSNGAPGIRIARSWSDVDVSDSTFTENSSDGVQLYLDNAAANQSDLAFTDIVADDNIGSGFQLLGSTGAGNGVLLDRVSADNNSHDGINVKGNWTNVDITNCTANENGVDGLDSDGDGISFHNSTTGSISYCVIGNNKKSAVAHVGDSDIDMNYNIFHHDTNGVIALIYVEGTGTYTMYNNTIYSAAQTGTGVHVSTPTGPTMDFKNNIMYGFDVGFLYNAGPITEDYNIVYNAASTSWSGLTPSANTLSADPLFADAANNDFSLLSGSPARDSGSDLGASLDDALHPSSSWLDSITTADQDLRGSGWEMGAYIYPVPQAPTIGTPSAQSATAIRWNFTDNADDETGFRVYDSTDTLVASAATSDLAYVDETGLVENTEYSGRYVTAYNSYGDSTPSATSSAASTTNDSSNDNAGGGGGNGKSVSLGDNGDSDTDEHDDEDADQNNNDDATTTNTNTTANTNPVSQAISNLILEYKDILTEAHEAGLSLPQYVLDIIGITVDVPVRDLDLGMEGKDVVKLQQLLNQNGFIVANTGFGAPGNESAYFGLRTQSALAAYQSAHSITPSNGYFGSITRAQMKASAVAGLWW